ncbi:MAG: tripartite tricarboxylate transporter TctB family protein [Planctomycetota bacterium]|jgi:hypothetical protein|nr:tripartite tricarboxylate transporter TctB family protein [Planctomycetota bacterium]
MRKTRDLVASAFVLAVAIFAFGAAMTQSPGQIGHPGPGFFPGVVAVFMFAMGILLLAKTFAQKSEIETDKSIIPSTRKDYLRVGILAAICAVYLELMDYAGFVLVTPPFCLIVALLLGERRPLVLILHCILVPVAIYVSFQILLSVPLPDGRAFY